MLDTVVAAETPEGILLELRPAGSVRASTRSCSTGWSGSLFSTSPPSWPGFMGGIGIAFWFILLFALEWFYPVVFELSRRARRRAKACSA